MTIIWITRILGSLLLMFSFAALSGAQPRIHANFHSTFAGVVVRIALSKG